MRYAIIGAGNVGAALASQFSRRGIPVAIANTRGPESLSALARELGANVTPQALADALGADVLFLAVPFGAHAALAAARADWSGKIVVDATNAFGVAPEVLGGRASSSVVAAAFRGARVVKGFNQLPAKILAQDPVDAAGRRVVFVASDDTDAEAAVAQLAGDLGFAPIKLGALEEGGKLIAVGGPLLLQNLVRIAPAQTPA